MNETVNPQQIQVASPTPPEAPAPRRHLVRRLIGLVILGLAALLAWQIFDRLETPPVAPERSTSGSGGPPATVRAAEAKVGDMPITIDALGTVTPLATVTVHTQIAGRLMSVGFEEGQHVKTGDFLAQVDDRPFQATLAQDQAMLDKDTALWKQAQADLARYETLNKQDSISRQQVDDQTFLVAQDAAAMASDQAQIDAAKLNISYAHIVAPVSGRVGLRLVDPGNYVQPTDANGIVVITQMDPISVVFSTPEDNLPRIVDRLTSGAKLQVQVRDRANTKVLATGELQTYDNEIDTTTGTVKLRALFPNANEALFPDQFVNVRLLVDTLKDAVLAPSAAVQIGANGPFVYVVSDDGTVSVRPVTTGASDSGQTAILTGLKAGERVVIDGVDRLRDGAKVVVSSGDGSGAPSGRSGSKPGGQGGAGVSDAQPRQHRHQGGQGGATGVASDGSGGPAPAPSPTQGAAP